VDPAGLRPPGGETVSEVAARVYAALDDIGSQFTKEDVLITSHGLALATVICKVKGMDLGQAYSVIPENAEPVWVTWPVPGL
jgi:broad specificity phosphatase PhoE